MASDLLGRTIHCANRRGRPIHVLRQILERDAPARFHLSPYQGAPQHWLDFHLGYAHRRLARHAAVIPIADHPPPFSHARVAKAVQLVAGQRGDPGDIKVVHLRHRHAPQCIDETEPSEQLHAPRVRDIHLGVVRGIGVALHQDARDATLH
jgi:hypothetical protein